LAVVVVVALANVNTCGHLHDGRHRPTRRESRSKVLPGFVPEARSHDVLGSSLGKPRHARRMLVYRGDIALME